MFLTKLIRIFLKICGFSPLSTTSTQIIKYTSSFIVRYCPSILFYRKNGYIIILLIHIIHLIIIIIM